MKSEDVEMLAVKCYEYTTVKSAFLA